MIVRISGEGQYQLPDDHAEELNELEGAVVSKVEGGLKDGFAEDYRALLEYVRTHGRLMADDELETSQLILPPADLTFEEAGKEFTGEGLIPD
jgi:hypothetical protein